MNKRINKTYLRKLKKDELLQLAEHNGISNPERLNKNMLIESLLREAPTLEAGIRDSESKRCKAQAGEQYSTDIHWNSHEQLRTRCVTEIQKSESAGTQVMPSSTGVPSAYVSPSFHFQLPYSYNTTKLVVIVRDPYWAFAYWDFDAGQYEYVMKMLRDNPGDLMPILRIHEITNVNFSGSNSNYHWDIDVDLNIKNWYLCLKEPNRYYIVELGLRHTDGSFFLIVRSNIVKTPLDRPSDIIDERWMLAEFEELFGRSLWGIGIASAELMQRRKIALHEWLSSGAVTSPVKKIAAEQEKNFFLELATELIVYGKTKPGAQLTVEGNPVTLRPDGSFSLRFSFPDGARKLPVIAVSEDKDDHRKITVSLSKKTQ